MNQAWTAEVLSSWVHKEPETITKSTTKYTQVYPFFQSLHQPVSSAELKQAVSTPVLNSFTRPATESLGVSKPLPGSHCSLAMCTSLGGEQNSSCPWAPVASWACLGGKRVKGTLCPPFSNKNSKGDTLVAQNPEIAGADKHSCSVWITLYPCSPPRAVQEWCHHASSAQKRNRNWLYIKCYQMCKVNNLK